MTQRRGTTSRDGADGARARDRNATLWTAVAFAAVALAGLLFFPGAWVVWITLLVFGVAAIPQAIVRARRPPDGG
jgi:fatty acid desaturase